MEIIRSGDTVPTMLLSLALSTFLSLATAAEVDFRFAFQNPDVRTPNLRIPSSYESAVQARRVLALQSIATLSTVFPHTDASGQQSRPNDVGGAPIGLMEYYASCGPETYNPTILAISIATSFENAKAGSNMTLSLRYHPPADRPPSDDPYTYSPANMPRFSLIGYLERLSPEEIQRNEVHSCFLKEHPHARPWTPGNIIHESWWAKLVVEEIYWIGGFGDRAYIGWIPLEQWQRVTSKEVANARLVGEHGWVPGAEYGEL